MKKSLKTEIAGFLSNKVKRKQVSSSSKPTTDREKLELALRVIRMGLYEWIIGEENIWWSKEVYSVYGVNKKTFKPTLKSIKSLIHPDDRESLWINAKEYIDLKKEFTLDYRIVRPDGEVRWVSNKSHIGLNEEGVAERITGVAVDITDRKQTEQRIEVLTKSIDDHLVTYDRKWRYTFVNEAAARVLGKKREELLGKCIWELFPDAVGNQYYRELHEALNQQKVIRSEHYYPPFNKWFENNIYPSEVGVTVFSTDITARKKMEAELVKSDKLKDEFLSLASHELKTPVTSIKAYSQIMEQRFRKAKDKNSAEIAKKMDAQISKLTNLIVDLLDVSKIESGQLKFNAGYFDVNKLVKEIVEETQRITDKHKIFLKLSNISKIFGDRERIGQVISNLLTNAIKYSPNNKKIIVKTFKNNHNKEIKFSIQDFGVGISVKDKHKIFERFYRARNSSRSTYSGLGLGLYISREIIKRHKGDIWVESKLGKGSTFYFSIPII